MSKETDFSLDNEHQFTLTLTYDAEIFGSLVIKLKSIQIGRNPRQYDVYTTLNDWLVPYIGKENYERCAQDFLTQYYPEALGRYVIPIDHVAIAKRMGLKFVLTRFTNEKIHAESIYRDGTALEIYDSDTKNFVSAPVANRTIAINVTSKYNQYKGFLKINVIHECLQLVPPRQIL